MLSSFLKLGFKLQLLVKMVIEDAITSNPDYVDLVKLIRSIQRAEGNTDCYRRGLESCNQTDCVWRDHCRKAPERPSKAGGESPEHKKAVNPKQERDSLHYKPELKGLW